MAEQIRKEKHEHAKHEETPAKLPSKNVDSDKMKAELDEMLDDIDEILESDAQAFVEGFVQRGGQ